MQIKSTLLIVPAAIFLIAAATPAAEMADIQKCTITAGRIPGHDSIAFSGTLHATADKFDGGDIVLTISSVHMPAPLTASFPVDETTFQRGKYTSPRVKVAKTDPALSLSYDTNRGKLSFTGKNVDLTGLSCPINIYIKIGNGYAAGADLDEDIVNGPKRPCPPQFLMGICNSVMISKAQIRLGKKPGTDSLNLSGFFTVAGDYDKENPVIASLGGQTFTVAGDQFTTRGFTENCTKGLSEEGPPVKAKFDFSKCTFQIQVQNAVIDDAGPADFALDCFGHELPLQPLEMPSSPAPRYELERYRCYDQRGRDWTYRSNYTITMDDGWDVYTDSGTMTGTLSVADSFVTVDGRPCFSVYAETADATVSSTWYQDYYGMHQCSSGNVSDMFDFDVKMDAVLAMPTLLSVGQTHKTSGAFTGNYVLDLSATGLDIEIKDFKGKAASETTLLGFEDVTVNYGSFSQAAKVRAIQTLKGSFIVELNDYGRIYRFRFAFTSLVEQTWWGVQDMGIVKSESTVTMKMGGAGESMSASTTVTDQLINYAQ